jgi:hypothetical protein
MDLDSGDTSEVPIVGKDLRNSTLFTNGLGELLLANPFELLRLYPDGIKHTTQ